MSNKEMQEVIEITTLAMGITTLAIPALAALHQRLNSPEPATLDELRGLVSEINSRSARIQAAPD